MIIFFKKGYVVNEKRLLEAQDKFQELKSTINFLQERVIMIRLIKHLIAG